MLEKGHLRVSDLSSLLLENAGESFVSKNYCRRSLLSIVCKNWEILSLRNLRGGFCLFSRTFIVVFINFLTYKHDAQLPIAGTN